MSPNSEQKLHFAIICLGSVLLLAPSSQADITLDGTTGDAGPVPGRPDYAITHNLGKQYSGNLFFSFSCFDLSKGESATFSGPGTVENILARVTGGSASRIDGLIRTEFTGSNPNLFFLNPYGITFGPNAKLDVQGAFHASTADYLKLGRENRFNASRPADSVLTSDAPSAFGFVGNHPAPIRFEGSQMGVKTGHTLSVVGGDVQIGNGARLTAQDGHFQSISVASVGEVKLAQADARLDTTGVKRFGTTEIVDGSTVDVSGSGGGRVFIRSGRFLMTGNTGSPSQIKASATGRGDSGGVELKLDDDLSMDSNSAIRADTSDAGRGGDIRVSATKVALTGDACLCTRTSSKAETAGNAGDVTINAKKVELKDGGAIRSESRGHGNSGAVTVSADDVQLRGASKAANGDALVSTISSLTHGDGSAGNVRIKSRRLTIEDRGEVNAATFGPGHGGNVDIDSRNIRITGLAQPAADPDLQFATGIVAGSVGDEDTKVIPSGDGGNIRIRADRVMLRDGGKISNETQGSGRGGDITVLADELLIRGHGYGTHEDVRDTPSKITVESQSFSPASDAGMVYVQARHIRLSDGGQIATGTTGPGSGGNLRISAEKLEMMGSYRQPGRSVTPSGVSARSESTGNGGDAGDIDVHAGRIDIRDGAEISVSTAGSGATGSVSVLAGTLDIGHGGRLAAESSSKGTDAGRVNGISVRADRLSVTDGGAVTISTKRADSGSIKLNVRDLIYLRDGTIDSSVANGAGHGGDIHLSAPYMVIDNGRIVATTDAGTGGHVFIGGGYLFQTPRSLIDVSSARGADGRIEYDFLSPDTAISSRATRLITPYADPTKILSERCSERTPDRASSFQVRGRDVQRPTADGWLASHYHTMKSEANHRHTGPTGEIKVVQPVDAEMFCQR